MINLKDVTKQYDELMVLNHITWNFPDKGLVCLLGPSGCGKSSLLNILAGFDTKYTGEVLVNDTSIHHMQEDELCSYRRNHIGFVFQDYHLLIGYSVLENVLIALEENDANIKRATQVLHRFHMEEKLHEQVEHLSGGEQQRVAIARALMKQPSIILADEPTGALDRKNAEEIMKLLKEIAKDSFVLVVTHDQKVCDYADYTITIKDGVIHGDIFPQMSPPASVTKKMDETKISVLPKGIKNFKVHCKRYLAVSFTIALSMLAFILSLSFGNVMDQEIDKFKKENTAFNNGYIKVENRAQEIANRLRKDHRIEHVYQQYRLSNICLKYNNNIQTISEKYPMPKATESMSYGTMPRKQHKEIALSPSLAKKFHNNIDTLVGNTITLTYQNKAYEVIVSGIFNAGYDDFFISSDLEQEFYRLGHEKKPYSISYDVKQFDEIIEVKDSLHAQNIETKTAAKEVEALQATFKKLNLLFFVISLLVMAVGIFISATMLVKMQRTRSKEFGLLSALGFRKPTIRSINMVENSLCSLSSVVLHILLIGIVQGISSCFDLPLMLTIPQLLLSTLATAILIIVICVVASYKVIHSDPVVALRSDS